MKMMALMLHDNYIEKSGLTKTVAVGIPGLVLGFNENTMVKGLQSKQRGIF